MLPGVYQINCGFCSGPSRRRAHHDADEERSSNVNDNFGRWRSDFNAQIQHCLRDGIPGEPVVELPRPDEDDYVVLKPKLSGFFSTTLDTLPENLDVQTVILADDRLRARMQVGAALPWHFRDG